MANTTGSNSPPYPFPAYDVLHDVSSALLEVRIHSEHIEYWFPDNRSLQKEPDAQYSVVFDDDIINLCEDQDFPEDMGAFLERMDVHVEVVDGGEIRRDDIALTLLRLTYYLCSCYVKN
jgi:hypothetical protein